MSGPPFPRRGLYAITGSGITTTDELVGAVHRALMGGAGAVQYRDKGTDSDRRAREAAALLDLCHDHGVPMIVNDDIELSIEVHADGVHLGRDDGAISAARDRLGPRAIIGASCYARADLADRAIDEGADYVAFGSFYPSVTKPGADRVDVDTLRDVRSRIRVPIVCIGGITPENGARLIAAGGNVLAVIHGIFGQADPMAAARRYTELFAPMEKVEE